MKSWKLKLFSCDLDFAFSKKKKNTHLGSSSTVHLQRHGGDPVNEQQPVTAILSRVISLQNHWIHVQ